MLSTTRPTYRSRRGTGLFDGSGVSSLSSPEHFLRMAMHELRSPLTAVRVQSQLGRRYLERGDDQRAQASLRTIEEQSFHMERMLKDLHDAAKIPQARFKVHPTRTNLVKVCERSIATQRSITGRDILTQFPANPVLLTADPEALCRLFEHLLLNAAFYSPLDSAIEIELSLTTSSSASTPTATTMATTQQVIASVRDQGSGISVEELSVIFDLFYRGGAGYETNSPGLGLGLALCKEIARLHNGDIWVTSQCPGGSTFFVRLPVIATL